MAINKADELVEEFPNSYMGYNIRGIAKAMMVILTEEC